MTGEGVEIVEIIEEEDVVSVEALAEEMAERLAAEDDATAVDDAPELVALSKELTSTLASIGERRTSRQGGQGWRVRYGRSRTWTQSTC